MVKNFISRVCAVSVLVACVIPGGCSDSDEKTTEYKNPEGLYVTTYYDAYNSQYEDSSDTRYWDQIIFYSETFPVQSLIGTEVTCHLLEEYPYFNLMKEFPEPIPCMNLTLEEKDFQATTRDRISGLPILRGCGDNGNMCIIYTQLPADYGDYHMYFTFENPEKGIYYKTSLLCYSFLGRIGSFATIIAPIN